jgi:hypothetical protein
MLDKHAEGRKTGGAVSMRRVGVRSISLSPESARQRAGLRVSVVTSCGVQAIELRGNSVARQPDSPWRSRCGGFAQGQ